MIVLRFFGRLPVITRILPLVLCAALSAERANAAPEARAVKPVVLGASILPGAQVPTNAGGLLLAYNVPLSKAPKASLKFRLGRRTRSMSLYTALGADPSLVGVALPPLVPGLSYTLSVSGGVSIERKRQRQRFSLPFIAVDPPASDPPLADAGSDGTANEGDSVQLNGTVSAGSAPFTYAWMFGDGTSDVGTTAPSHTFADNGTFTVSFGVTDALGRVSIDSMTLTVQNVPPSASAGGPYAAAVNTPIAFTGSASDPSSADVAAGFTYQWSFGDGTSASGQSISKAYTEQGTYQVTLTVSDKDGGAATATATATITSSGGGPDPGDPTGQPRVQQSQLQWLGAFRLPSGTFGPSRFGYGGAAPGYHKDAQSRETLFMEGHAWYKGNAAQVQIPQLSSSRDVDDLPRATLLQPFADATDGKLGGRSGDGLGSMMSYNGRLLIGSYVYYDADGGQQRFIGASGFNLSSTTDFKGFFSPAGVNPGRLGRYMTTIPSEWQSRLGGPAVSGACCLSIISRTNSGPGISVFNPDDVGVGDSVPFKEVLGYPLDHPVKFGSDQGGCTAQSNVFNCTSSVVAVAFPAGTRSVLFFGSQGTGPVCYKDDGPVSCRGTGGYNAPPYRAKVWAYDANDLVRVKNGEVPSWSVSPYGLWDLDFEYNSGSVSFAGGTFDPATNRLFLIETNAEDPIVHVLTVNVP